MYVADLKISKNRNSPPVLSSVLTSAPIPLPAQMRMTPTRVIAGTESLQQCLAARTYVGGLPLPCVSRVALRQPTGRRSSSRCRTRRPRRHLSRRSSRRCNSRRPRRHLNNGSRHLHGERSQTLAPTDSRGESGGHSHGSPACGPQARCAPQRRMWDDGPFLTTVATSPPHWERPVPATVTPRRRSGGKTVSASAAIAHHRGLQFDYDAACPPPQPATMAGRVR